MRHCTLTLLLLLLATAVSAQQDRRTWADGPLTWGDFRTVMSPDGNSSHLQYQFGYEPAKAVAADGIACSYYRAVAWMDPSQSWVDANQRTDLNLRFNQVVFNLVEVERRQMARALASCANKFCLTSILNTAHANLDNSVRSLRAATSDGTDEAALQAWEASVRRRLDTLLPDTQVPSYELLPLSIALTLGAAMQMPTGDVADLFTSGAGMHFGIEVGWNRHIFTSEAFIASSRLRMPMWFQDNEGGIHQLDKDAPAAISTGVLTYGYRVWETTWQSLTPMAGWSWGTRTLADGDSRGTLSTHGPALGLAYRHHFWQRYRLPGSMWSLMAPSHAELSRWSIEARLMLVRHSYDFENGDASGWSLQLSLGVAFGARAAR